MEELISDVVEKIEKERDRMDDSFSENSDGDGEMESEVEVQASEDPSDGSEVDEVALSARSCQFCNKLFSTKGNKEDHEKYVHKKGPISKLLQIGWSWVWKGLLKQDFTALPSTEGSWSSCLLWEVLKKVFQLQRVCETQKERARRKGTSCGG